MDERDQDLLSLYIDNALPADERTALESRLQSEPVLRRELELLRETKALINALPQLKAPRDFVLTAAQAQTARPPAVLSVWASVLSAAAALIFVVAGIVTLNNRPAEAPQNAQVALQPTTSPTQGINPAPPVVPQGTAPLTTTMADAFEEAAPEARSAVVPTLSAPTDANAAEAGGAAMDSMPMAAPESAVQAVPATGGVFTTEATAQGDTVPPSTAVSLQAAPTATLIPTIAPTSTLAPTATATPEPTTAPAEVTPEAVTEDNANGVSIVLIAIGLVLAAAAVLTTLLRQRRG